MNLIYHRAAPIIHEFLKPLSARTRREVMNHLKAENRELFDLVISQKKSSRKLIKTILVLPAIIGIILGGKTIRRM